MINITAFNDPKSPISEAYRSIRTNIQFSRIDNEMKAIVVTSSKQDEGKTTVTSNLVVSFASLEGKRVLLIDADLRNPSVHKMFSKANGLRLTDVLTGKKELRQCVQNTELENLQIITAGTIPLNPGEILESKKMREFINGLRDYYDYIFIDTPPIGIIMDAGVLANYADGIILVVGSKDVETERAKMAKERLEKVKANIIGAVLNKYIEKNGSYGYYSYYYDQSDSSRVSKYKNKKKH